MKRAQNWPAKLALFIEEKRQTPFDWATNNCAFFACDWLAIVHGLDPAADMRGKIWGALSAARALDAAGGIEKIVETACDRWGWPEIPLPLVGRGDVVVIDMPDGPTVGVCEGAHACFAGKEGIEFHPTSSCRRAWKI